MMIWSKVMPWLLTKSSFISLTVIEGTVPHINDDLDKSQGMTFDQIIIDMQHGAFDYGQTYVALSRCTHLEGVFLKRPLRPADIQTDDQIVDYYRKIF